MVTINPTVDEPVGDLDASGAGCYYSTTCIAGGAFTDISDLDMSVFDPNDDYRFARCRVNRS